MRDETAEWLNPMLEAAEEHQILIRDLIVRSTMPAAEADSPSLDALASLHKESGVEGARLGAVDWVRVGQLLRSGLCAIDPAWGEYPEWPSSGDREEGLS